MGAVVMTCLPRQCCWKVYMYLHLGLLVPVGGSRGCISLVVVIISS